MGPILPCILVHMDMDLKNKTLQELEQLVAQEKGRAFDAKYIFSFIHEKHIGTVEEISPLPKSFRQRLIDAGYHISQLDLVDRFVDPDGTIKFLFALPDDTRFEAVLLRDGDRDTLCISSQAGCKMACGFCATGAVGYLANLTGAQIVDQVYQIARAGHAVHNIVYMGMGEPFDNTQEVLRSVRILNDPAGQHIGQRRITVSTCGLPEGIRHLSESRLQVRLAVSLHACNDQARSKLMPINNRHPLSDLLEAIRAYQKKIGRRITFEYCLMKDINDSTRDAQELIRVVKGIKANVNLIEFNEFPGCDYQPSDKATIHQFAAVLQEAGVETVVRFKRGQSIRAACGQLGADWLGHARQLTTE